MIQIIYEKWLLIQFLVPIIFLVLTFIFGEQFFILGLCFLIGFILGVLSANIGWLNMIKKLKF